MNFNGVHFEFVGKDIARRKYKELPFPTKENRCELCTFALPCVDTNGSLVRPNRTCKLLVIGFDYDLNEPMFAWVKITGTCTRFKRIHEFKPEPGIAIP